MYINPKHKQADDNGGSAIPAAVGGAAIGAGGYLAYKHLNEQGPSLAHRFMNNKLSKFMAGAGGVAAAGAGLWQVAKGVGTHMAAQAKRAEKVTGASGATTVVNAAKKQEAAKTVVQEAKATTKAPKMNVAKKSAPDHSFAISEMEKLKGKVQQAHVKEQNTRPNTPSSSENKTTPYSPAYQGGSNSWGNKLNNRISNFFTS